MLDLKLPDRHTVSEQNPIDQHRCHGLKAWRKRVKVREPDGQISPEVVRADMESALPKRQSLRTAGKLPEELYAAICVG